MKTVELLYGKEGMNLVVPDEAALLAGQEIPPLPQVERAVEEALACPIGAPSLGELVRARSPRTVAITISDITRPVPNKIFLPPMLRALKAAGVEPSQVVIIIGTGMHRPSTIQERESLVGREILQRVEIIDHTAHDPSTLTQVSADPAVSVNRRFMEADLRMAQLHDARLAGTNLQGACLQGADLLGVIGLTLEQVKSAHIDAKTRLPDYLREKV